MSKGLMYLLITIGSGIGGGIPLLFGDTGFGGWSIMGSLLGGLAGIVAYIKLRQNGYIE